MTETQINHRAPLAPGEIRAHTVGAKRFTLMHVAGGSFTQASVSGNGIATRVICTDRFADVAVRAYADAIEQAESDAVDALDDADAPSFTAAGAYVPAAGPFDKAIAEAERFEGIDRAAVARGESANWWERGTAPEPGSLASLLDAYGEAVARGAIELTGGALRGDGDPAALLRHTERADALKAEILARFGGER